MLNSVPTPILLLVTATTLTLISQLILNIGVPKPSSQVIAWVKYTGPLVASMLSKLVQPHTRHMPAKAIGASAKRYLLLIGLLDICAYSLLSSALATCGAGFTLVIFSAAGQLCTAVTCIFIQRKQLLRNQYLAVLLVLIGLLVRATPWLSPTHTSKEVLSNAEALGVVAMIVSAVIYAVEGAIYEKVLSLEGPNVPHAEVARLYTSVGAVALTLYQLVYTLPNWKQLVAEPYQNGQTSLLVILGLYIIHGAFFVVHNQVNSITIQKNGVLAVGIVNACRSVVMAVISHGLFCTPEKPLQCLNQTSATSALVITGGALTWALAGRNSKKPSKKDD